MTSKRALKFAVAIALAALPLGSVTARVPQVSPNQWDEADGMVTPRAGASSVLLGDGRVLITGGIESAVTNAAEVYDPTSETFVSVAAMAEARANHTSTLLRDGRVLVTGGVGADSQRLALSTAEIFDPQTNSWSGIPSMSFARSGHTATMLHDGRVLIAGGDTGGPAPGAVATLEAFEPAGQFDVLGDLNRARTAHAASLLSDGRVVISGGVDQGAVRPSFEIFDPDANAVTDLGALAVARAGHTSTTLLDGRVLIVGGSNLAGEISGPGSGELYNPQTNISQPTGLSFTPRQHHQAILLPHNNQVLIVGGSANGNAVDTAELYIPWQLPGGALNAALSPRGSRAWSTASALSFPADATVRSGPNDGLLLLAGGSPFADASTPTTTADLYGFATVKTDHADYSAGATVTITGGGWQPGETVTLRFESTRPDAIARTYSVDANAAGQIIHDDFVPEAQDADFGMYVTATGSASEARTLFTVSPAPVISIDDGTLLEGDSGTSNAVFTVSLSHASSETVTVDYATADGTATTVDNDYQGAIGTLTFAPGVTTRTVTVLVNGDLTVERDETYAVTLSGAANAVLGDVTGDGIITNDDTQVGIDNVTVVEGNGGPTNAIFTVSLSNPSPRTVTVDYATGDGTAMTAGNDYQSAGGTLTFAPGETTQPVTVVVNGDLVIEPDEFYFVTLSNVINATLADPTGLGTITTDDDLPVMAIGDVSHAEGNSGTTNASFTVSLSRASGQTVTANYATVDGTATLADNDYESATGMVTFAPGVTTQSVTVPVTGDTRFEPTETYTVTLSNPANATIGDATGVGTITNDDDQPVVAIGSVAQAEGQSGTTSMVFTVSLSNASYQTVTVDYATVNGTATQADDFQSATGTVTFTPGVTMQTVTVAVLGDLAVEPNETYAVTLSNAVNATLGDATGAGTITNDDAQVAIDDVSLLEGNGGPTSMVFTVSLSNASSQTVSVDYATADGTATTGGNDYQSATATVTFAPGVTSQSVTVLINGDLAVEPNETFFVNLSNAVNATLGDAAGAGAIVNDDAQVAIDDVTVVEGNGGTTAAVFTVSLSNASPHTVTVEYATANDTATLADNDYQSATGTVTFAPGVTSQPVTVLISADLTAEPDETYVVTLSNAVNATFADTAGMGTILNDDAQPVISINDVTLAEGNSGSTRMVFTVSLSNASGQPVTVNFATADGTATLADNDYRSGAAGALTFAPGITTQSVTVLVNGDTKFEPSETYTVNLSDVDNATLGDAAGLGTILNDDGQPVVGINDVTLAEGNSGTRSMFFAVSLSNASAEPVTVNFATADGTATLADNDYQGATGTLTFAPGVTSQPVTVLVNGDTRFEPSETYAVNLSDADNATLGDAAGLGTILNDDAQPVVEIKDIALAEGNSGTTSMVFTVSLSNASSQTVTVNFATADGTATLADNDYQGAAGTLTFAPGMTSQSVTVLVTGDTRFEPSEAYTVNLSGAVNATLGDATGLGTILNDDGQPVIAINDVSVAEGNSGTTAAIFTVSLSNPSSQAVTVDFATANGTATVADSDYLSAVGTLTIAPGATSQSVTVLVNGDLKFEPNETYTVNLSNAGNATLGDAEGAGTITNDDDQPVLAINNVLQAEGNSGTRNAIFTVSLSSASGQTVTVDFATADGSATVADNDYQSATGTLTFAPGMTSQQVTVLVTGDTRFEPNETYTVNLSNARNASIGDAAGLGTILSDDGQPTVSLNDVSVAEGNTGTTAAVLTLSLSNASSQTVTVNFATADGTATLADNDYQGAAGTVTFAPGMTSQSVTVLVNGDTHFEPSETYTVNLSGAANATLGDATGVGTILNDDAQPVIAINDVSLPEGNSGTTAMVFTLSLSNASGQPVTVNFATADGTATLVDNDYQSSAGMVTFAPGMTSQTLTVLVNGDIKFELDETYAVNLSGAENATLGDAMGVATIINDDAQPVIAINDVSLAEGNSGTTAMDFTVSLSNASGQTVSVNFATTNGSATLADNDYQSTTGTVTFTPGMTTQTVTVLVNGDTRFEPSETYVVNLGGAVNATVGNATGLGTILNDDAQPVIAINDVTLLEGNSGTTSAVFTVSLSNASAQTVTVNFATANGTATLADNDYQTAAGTVTFAAGVTSQPVTVLVNGDTTFEPNESFLVNLSGAVNASIGDAQATGAITNDDVMAPNQPPVAGPITWSATVDPLMINTSVTSTVTFTDGNVTDTHTAIWNWGDGTTSAGTVAVPAGGGTGSITGTHLYNATGMYTVTVTITDNRGLSASSVYSTVNVVNPTGGAQTGLGQFASQAGAYTRNPSLTGSVTILQLSARYAADGTMNLGTNTFRISYAPASMSMTSTRMFWMVRTATKSWMEGEGNVIIGGVSEPVFYLLSTVDSTSAPDKVRLKIWNRTTGAVIYDNQPGAPDDADATRLTTSATTIRFVP